VPGSESLELLFSRAVGRQLEVAVLCEPYVRQNVSVLGRRALMSLDLPEVLVFPVRGVSLSHTQYDDTAIAIAVSDPSREHALGVDIEPIRLRHYGYALAKRFLTPEEYGAFELLDVREQESALIRLWTIKEAVWKAHQSLGSKHKTPPVTRVKIDAIDAVADETGRASLGGEAFFYVSCQFGQAWVSLAWACDL
jgi:phosphopantetheine--protein transferase-like protein